MIAAVTGEDLFPGLSKTHIILGNLGWRFGHLTNDTSLIFLCQLVRVLDAHLVLEFGTFTGRTTYNLALNMPDNGRIYTLDIGRPTDTSNVANRNYENYVPGECFLSADEGIKKKIVPILADSRSYPISQELSNVNLVIIDGGHEYEVICSDTINALKVLRKGGVIVWDDYSPYWPGVKRLVDELSVNVRLFGLPREGFIIFKNA